MSQDALELPGQVIRDVVGRALEEDLPAGDVTSDLLVPVDLPAAAVLVARAEGVVAGLPLAGATFLSVDPTLQVDLVVSDGERVQAGQALLRVRGRARGILAGERVALNFVQRLSGTATLASRFVAEVAGTGARIVDTRKTTPGLRLLEKYAVRCGGAGNHRFHLGDMVLVKDNHREALAEAGISLEEAVRAARRRLPDGMLVEIEVDDAAQLEQALAAQPDVILLDNMSPEQLTESVRRIRAVRPETKVEASGGVRLETVRAIAQSGVDLISVGALTHSAPAFDVSLEYTPHPAGEVVAAEGE